MTMKYKMGLFVIFSLSFYRANSKLRNKICGSTCYVIYLVVIYACLWVFWNLLHDTNWLTLGILLAFEP
jgi:hypothetical protein